MNDADGISKSETVGRVNIDEGTVASFGDEWSNFDQSNDDEELHGLFRRYFQLFPWDRLPSDPEGFDMGCGSGRWARYVSPRVGRLNCIDASDQALQVARRNLGDFSNVRFINAAANSTPLKSASQDFGYSLGVLHHIPDTSSALMACVALLKPGAPFLLYLYYRFDNRPLWFRLVWRASDLLRSQVSRLPSKLKRYVTDSLALAVYWPLARFLRLLERLGLNVHNLPLSGYRHLSFYTMRTDSRDRFGTPLERRFTRSEIHSMMQAAGLVRIVFSEGEPYWCAVGIKG